MNNLQFLCGDRIFCRAIENYSALHFLMNGPNDVKELKWTPNLGKYFKQAVPANKVKGLCKIYGGHKEWLLLFPTFLL